VQSRPWPFPDESGLLCCKCSMGTNKWAKGGKIQALGVLGDNIFAGTLGGGFFFPLIREQAGLRLIPDPRIGMSTGQVAKSKYRVGTRLVLTKPEIPILPRLFSNTRIGHVCLRNTPDKTHARVAYKLRGIYLGSSEWSDQYSDESVRTIAEIGKDADFLWKNAAFLYW